MLEMVKLFEIFPDTLKREVVEYRMKNNKKRKNSNKLRKSKDTQKKIYAFPRVRKLPLESERNVLSAMTHFANVKNVTDKERSIALKKIIKSAKRFEICTMGFIEKYAKYVSKN